MTWLMRVGIVCEISQRRRANIESHDRNIIVGRLDELRQEHGGRANHFVSARVVTAAAVVAKRFRPLAVLNHHRHRNRRFGSREICDDLWLPVCKDSEVFLFQAGNNLAALLVIDDCIDVDDLRRDGNFLGILRPADQIGRRRFLLFSLAGSFARPLILFFVAGGWLASRLCEARTS